MTKKTDGRKNNGGPNRGAGRKPLPADERKVTLTIKISPRLMALLKAAFNKGEVSSNVEAFIAKGLSDFNTF